jgi:DNA-binding response OmpR family regulator
MMAEGRPFSLLIIEDEALVLSSLRRAAEAAGLTIAATARSVPEALACLDEFSGAFDAALLDANLRGISSAPVAARLRDAGLPYLVITGYTAAHVEALAAGQKILHKPVRSARLLEALHALKRG